MQPLSLLNIEDIQVFAEATVESSIMMLQNTKSNAPFLVANLSIDYMAGTSLSDYLKKNSFEYKIPETSEWVIGNEITGILKSKIQKDSKPLKDFNLNINIGLITGLNVAYLINEETKNSFINEDPNCKNIIHPVLRGRDLKKYIYEFDKMYVINSHNGLKNKNIQRVEVEWDYPIIYNHLKKYLPSIEERYNQGDHWSNLRSCVYLEEFEKPKIIWGEISDKPKFAYDDCNFYAEATTFFMTGDKLKFLLAILNSKELLPIKVPSETIQLQLESLVDQIILLKKDKPTYDTSSIESEIDRLVYQLYELTSDEILIVEGTMQ